MTLKCFLHYENRTNFADYLLKTLKSAFISIHFEQIPTGLQY